MARVLYVDDDLDLCEIAEISLQWDPTLEVKVCSSGREALILAVQWRPDIILLDVMMPEMDGPTIFRRLRALPETSIVPVVFVSARAQPHEIEEFEGLGIIDFIQKPFEPMALAASVRKFLNK
ncbi:response regulator [Aquisediminimonas sediminicola]|uniref:response regulator n=1 Tax=Alteraquisediminimonas sediminicola TaxID=2676787 RepID=UPI001C8EE56F|nr:response regulator [Aquisediminimonas sediminicola]